MRSRVVNDNEQLSAICSCEMVEHGHLVMRVDDVGDPCTYLYVQFIATPDTISFKGRLREAWQVLWGGSVATAFFMNPEDCQKTGSWLIEMARRFK